MFALCGHCGSVGREPGGELDYVGDGGQGGMAVWWLEKLTGRGFKTDKLWFYGLGEGRLGGAETCAQDRFVVWRMVFEGGAWGGRGVPGWCFAFGARARGV